MTLRHKLADWISGMRKKPEPEPPLIRRKLTYVLCEREDGSLFFMPKSEVALHQIIAQETPSANATVRRMAAIAKEALE